MDYSAVNTTQESIGSQPYEALQSMLYRSLGDLSREITFSTDMAGKWTFLSPSWEKITGFTLPETLSRNCIEFIHPQDQPLFLELLINTEHHPELNTVSRVRCLTREGSYRLMEIRMKMIPLAPGKSMHMGGVMLDISVDKIEMLVLGDHIRKPSFSEDPESWMKRKKCFRALIESSADAIALLDDKGSIVYLNPTGIKMLGYPPEEHLGQKGFEHLHPDESEAMIQTLTHLLSTPGSSARQEFRLRHQQGHWIWVECFTQNLLGHPHINAVIATYRDVTERRMIEAELAKQHHFIRQITETLPLSVFTAHLAEGQASWISPQFYNLLGYTEQEWNRLSLSDQYNLLHAEDHWIITDMVAFLQRKPDGEIYEGEYRLRHKNGNWYWFYTRITAFRRNADGELVEILGTIQDVTHRKQIQVALRRNEERFRSLTDTAPVMIWMCDPHQYCNFLNRGWINFRGRVLNEKIEDSWTQGLHPDDVARCKEQFRQAFVNKQPFKLEYRLLHTDENYYWILDTGIPHFTDEGSFAGYIGSCIDITDRKEAEQCLHNTMEELKRRNYELDTFVYKVSHDLRAPLSSILGLVNLMKIEEDGEAIKQYVQLVENSVRKLDGFIQSILNHSKTLNSQVEYVPINFRKIISECLQELKYHPNSERVKTIIELEEESVFYNEELKLNIIFKNFISNSIKYINPFEENNFLKFDIRISQHEACMLIEDNGIGISPQYVSRIFEMFYRATDTSEGSGLGLYIVKQTIEKMGGSIQVNSEAGKGTKFRICLPNHGE